jgi:hypothetical protein
MAVCLALHGTVMLWAQGLREAGCRVEHDADAGTLEAWDDDTCVYRAIRKGRGGPWIVRTSNGDHIKWKSEETQT